MWRKFISAFVIISLTFSLISGTASASEDGASAYVTDLYLYVLDRAPDEQGLNTWTSALESGDTTGAAVAYGFIFGDECLGRGLDDRAFVEVLYRALLGRQADEAGLSEWVNELASGMSREELFAGFVNSQEFCIRCSELGFTGGTHITGADTTTVANTNMFVKRLYSTTLQRDADLPGLYDWTSSIVNGSGSGAITAYGFFFSPEYIARDRSDEEFVTDLYTAMLDRSPDDSGMAYWLDLLAQGYTRELIFSGFVYSAEFGALCQSYGIRRGDYSANGWCLSGRDRIYVRNGSRLCGWASIGGHYYYFDRSTGILATNTTVNGIAVDRDGIAEDTEFARQKIPVMIRAREILLSITTPNMSVYEKQMACSRYVMAFPYLMKDYLVGRHANDWACVTAHYANNILNAYGDQLTPGGECFAEAAALAYLFVEINAGQVYVNRDYMHGWCEMNGMFWDPLFAESRGLHYLNMLPSNYEEPVPPVQYPL